MNGDGYRIVGGTLRAKRSRFEDGYLPKRQVMCKWDTDDDLGIDYEWFTLIFQIG